MNGNTGIAFADEDLRCVKLLIAEIRSALLLSLKYLRGENAKRFIAEKNILVALDKLSRLEAEV